jgi:hypothetical protein
LVSCAAALAASFALFAADAAAQAAAAAAPVRYVRTTSAGVKMYNLADTKAEVVLNLPADTLLAVYSERAGYLEAEAPQSLEVWVYGKFVKPTSDASLLEATETVLMRPLPSSEERSYPLGQRLRKGERVRMIARADESKPFKEDWVRVLAPPGTRAWVQAGATQPLASGTDALAAWAAAVKEAQAAAAARFAAATPASSASAGGAATTLAAAASTAATGAPAGAPPKNDALEEAQKLLNAAKASAEPDYAPARAAFQKILDESAKGSVAANEARMGLDKITVLEEIERLKRDAKLVDQRRREELEKAHARLRELSVKQDPLWGRFQARGWVERAGDRYVIRWSGKNTAGIECQSGRYELADYLGFEVGVTGVTTRGPIAATPGSEGEPPLVEVTRFEVISGRSN